MFIDTLSRREVEVAGAGANASSVRMRVTRMFNCRTVRDEAVVRVVKRKLVPTIQVLMFEPFRISESNYEDRAYKCVCLCLRVRACLVDCHGERERERVRVYLNIFHDLCCTDYG